MLVGDEKMELKTSSYYSTQISVFLLFRACSGGICLPMKPEKLGLKHAIRATSWVIPVSSLLCGLSHLSSGVDVWNS